MRRWWDSRIEKMRIFNWVWVCLYCLASHFAEQLSIRDEVSWLLMYIMFPCVQDKELRGQDVNLSGLESCEVRLCGPPSTLHMSRMEHCTWVAVTMQYSTHLIMLAQVWRQLLLLVLCSVLCSPVSSSVFVEDCKHCVFVVACQQLRVHSTVHSQFYLHVTSRAIIEDCKGISIAPYAWPHPQLNEHFEVSTWPESALLIYIRLHVL